MNSTQRAEIGDERLDHAVRLGRFAMARGFAHDHADEHRRQRECRAGDIRRGPADAGSEHQRERAGSGGAEAPAVLRHARARAELARLEQLDAVGVDDDVEGGAGHAERDRRHGDEVERCVRVRHAEEGDGGDDQHADEPEPAAPLAEAADERQPDVVDDRRPQELEVVGEEGERESGHGALARAVLGKAGAQRRADHREGEARGNAEEQRRQRRALEIRAHALGQPKAHGRSRR